MMLDIAMRPAVSMTSVSPQSSQEMSDGMSFADELSLTNEAIPTLQFSEVLNPVEAQSAALAAARTAGPAMSGGGSESVHLTPESMGSMMDHPHPEPTLRLVSDRAQPLGEGRAVAMTPKLVHELSQSKWKSSEASSWPTQLSSSIPPSQEILALDEAWELYATEGSFALTGSGFNESNPPRVAASELQSSPTGRWATPGPGAHRSSVSERREHSHPGTRRIRETDETMYLAGQKPFTERLTELSMMVADLRNDESFHRLATVYPWRSSLPVELDAGQSRDSAVHESMNSQWPASVRGDVNPRGSFSASEEDSVIFDASEAIDDSPSEPTQPIMSSVMPHQAVARLSDPERVNHIPEPLRVTVEHLRSLLPEGGRLLEVQPHLVRLEVVHASGPLQLEVVMRSGVVDVRAHGVGAAEMAWRVPELAAALHGTGMRLGTFDVQPARRGRESSSSDRGHTGHRQDLDDTAEETVRNVSTAGRRVSR